MKNFINWCEEKGKELPSIDENATRAGIKFGYPDAYKRSQYPQAYFASGSATSYLDIKNRKAFKSVEG